MNTILIREAQVADAFEMMELIKELAVFEKAAHEVTVEMDHFIESGFGEHPVWWAIVAEDLNSKKVVALALYYIRYSTWKGQRMYLEDIVISEQYRRKGIGTKLMDRLIEIAKEKKLSGMQWQVLDWNQEAIDFYKKYSVKIDDEWLNVSKDLN